ncbi:DUF397 domain-containing protein [Streptomyces sp. V3I7]|uniref:DUF397 domain-containing protein n=1 Tax=Streptomyces sp. V3I7 TaxID=3042278 RepID=UPI0027809491|nr:DUF397 domain-containing protein [Streptomyces sp. V3I7]MDQ0990525.1 hypothetical protein [Streptomyces sp. V3I7]
MIRKAPAADRPEPDWFKSSYSDGPDGNSCVEIAIAITPATAPVVHVRDSKSPRGPRLTLTPSAWADFLAFTGRD